MEKPKSKSWDDATPLEILEARVQAQEEALQQLCELMQYAFRYYSEHRHDAFAGRYVSDMIAEEWGK